MSLDIRYDKEFVEQAHKALGLKFYDADAKRSIYITAYKGSYGIAGYVITIEGSPPLATFILQTSNANLLIGIRRTGNSKLATEITGNAAMRYIREYLIGHINRNA